MWGGLGWVGLMGHDGLGVVGWTGVVQGVIGLGWS